MPFGAEAAVLRQVLLRFGIEQRLVRGAGEVEGDVLVLAAKLRLPLHVAALGEVGDDVGALEHQPRFVAVAHRVHRLQRRRRVLREHRGAAAEQQQRARSQREGSKSGKHHGKAPVIGRGSDDPLRRIVAASAQVGIRRRPAEQRAGAHAAFAQRGLVGPTQVNDAVAVAVQPLEVALQRRAASSGTATAARRETAAPAAACAAGRAGHGTSADANAR